MQFAGQELKEILRNQSLAVEVVAADGSRKNNISSQYAADVLVTDDIIGIGHAKRIRYIQPANLRRQVFASRCGLVAAKQPPPRMKPVKRNETAGRLDFAPQPSFAQTGHAGRVHRVVSPLDIPDRRYATGKKELQ